MNEFFVLWTNYIASPIIRVNAGELTHLVTFTRLGDVQKWLQGKPHDWAITIGTRAALRVIPLLVGALDRGGDSTKARREIILPALRSIAAPWIVANYPDQIARLRAASAFVTIAQGVPAVAEAAFEATSHAAASAASAAAAAKGGADIAILAGTLAVTQSSLAAVLDTDDNVLVWASVAADVTLLEGGMSPAELAGRKLWLSKRPAWVSSRWKRLKGQLIQANENWEVWTEWYEARLKGGAANESLEVARVMMADENWSQGPEVVNAEIKRLIQEYALKAPAERIPEVPAQGPGPRYRANENGLVDRARSTDIDESGNDAGTIRNLLPLAQRCAEDLRSRLSPNQFPELLATTERYLAAFKPPPGSNIEWGEVWGLGVMLQNAAAASERKIDGRLIEALEDSAKAALDSLLIIHGPLILATGDGAKLSEVAAGFAMTREQQDALRQAAERVAEDLRKRQDIITPNAANAVVQAVQEIGQGPHPERGSVFALATVKNVSVVLIGGAAVATPALIGAMLGATLVGALVGAPFSLVVVEAVKKNPAFNALVTQLGAKLETMTDIELRAWLDERARRYAPFRSFVIDNQEHLCKIAEATPELKWMLRYIDFIGADPSQK